MHPKYWIVFTGYVLVESFKPIGPLDYLRMAVHADKGPTSYWNPAWGHDPATDRNFRPELN